MTSLEARGADLVGFVGLGNMGKALCTNLASSGFPLVVFDIAGTDGRAPDSARCAASLVEVAEARTVVLSLPDGEASRAVVKELASAPDRRTSTVINTSTIGIAAAREIDASLRDEMITYVDAPVSGGVAGALNRRIAIMCAAPDEAYEWACPVLQGMSDRHYLVGTTPGMGQAVKLANNFLSATALAATSEAIAFGIAAGLDPTVMLEVLNASSGQSAATSDKFPNHVVTGKYASGFTNTLMAKDLALYRAAVTDTGTPCEISSVTIDVWEQFAEKSPQVDFTRIYQFVSDTDTDGV